MLEDAPIDLKIDEDGDLAVESGDLVLTSGLPGTVQACMIAMKLIRGEVFFDLDAGIPYLLRPGVPITDVILGQKFNEAKARAAFVAALLDVDNVTRVLELTFAFDGDTRALSVRFKVRTAFGDTDLETLDMEV